MLQLLQPSVAAPARMACSQAASSGGAHLRRARGAHQGCCPLTEPTGLSREAGVGLPEPHRQQLPRARPIRLLKSSSPSRHLCPFGYSGGLHGAKPTWPIPTRTATAIGRVANWSDQRARRPIGGRATSDPSSLAMLASRRRIGDSQGCRQIGARWLGHSHRRSARQGAESHRRSARVSCAWRPSAHGARTSLALRPPRHRSYPCEGARRTGAATGRAALRRSDDKLPLEALTHRGHGPQRPLSFMSMKRASMCHCQLLGSAPSRTVTDESTWECLVLPTAERVFILACRQMLRLPEMGCLCDEKPGPEKGGGKGGATGSMIRSRRTQPWRRRSWHRRPPRCARAT